MTRTLLVFAVAATCLSAAGASRAAESPIESFVGCGPDFFDVVKAQRGVFGEISVTKSAGDGRDDRMESGGEASFAKPLRAFGLRFRSYRQVTAASSGFTSWSWGFVADSKPRQIAFAIDPYVRKKHISAEGFSREGENYWRASVGFPKSGFWRELRVFDLKNGRSLLACSAIQGVYESFPGLPDIEELFGASASPR